MLTPDELLAVRTEALDWLPDYVTITAATETSDGGGEVNVVYAVQWSGKGRLAPLMVTERVFADDVKAIADSVVTLPWDCPITERHRLQIRVAGAAAATPFDVVKVSSAHSLQLHVRAAVVRAR